MSKRSRRRQKRSLSYTIFIAVSLLLAASMILSLVLVALPGPPAPTPTPWPTWTLPARPSPTPLPTEPPPTPLLSPTEEPTAPPIGPVLPTATPVVTPTLTATPASVGLSFTFAICGDSRDNPRVYRQVLDGVKTSNSEFLISTGDLVNNGTEAQWQAFGESMADFPLPFYPVPGNHDALGGRLDGFLAHSGAPAAHYSFDYGSVHFVMADSHHGGISADELAWLRVALSTTNQPVKAVFLHHPPFDPDGTDHSMAFGNQNFMALMVEQQVDYVFAGHIHAFAQEDRDGVKYIITGGAGAPLYTKDHPQAFHHYLLVTVNGEDVEIEVVKI